MKLFEPIKLGSLTLKNHLALAPMDTELSGLHGEVTRDIIIYYTARAAGGVGLIITEFTAVDEIHRLTSPSMYSDRFIAGWSTLVEKLHSFGTGVILQIAHHGGRALERITGTKPVAPSAVASPIYPEVPRELTRDEIKDLIAKLVRAAERAKAAGFDGVEIHAGHGYLIGEFISPHTNRRTDEYGGSLENRLRFPVEILKRIRESLGSDFVVGFKFSAYEAVEGGIDVQQAVDIARYMEAQGVDYLHVSVLSFPLPERRFPSVPLNLYPCTSSGRAGGGGQEACDGAGDGGGGYRHSRRGGADFAGRIGGYRGVRSCAYRRPGASLAVEAGRDIPAVHKV